MLAHTPLKESAVRGSRAVALVLLAAACASFPRRLEPVALRSQAMGRTLQYATWLPPGWTPDEHLPLVVFLHGASDSPASFDRFEVGQALDEAVRTGAMPRLVLVAPEGNNGMWTNWHDGTHRYEDWVMNEVIPDAQARYRPLPCPEGCHIAGISMGGSGALRIALHHPGRFASVSSLSGLILDAQGATAFREKNSLRFIAPLDRIFGPMNDPAALAREDLFQRWTRPTDLGGLRVWLGWGDRDREDVVRTSAAFDRHLSDRGIPHGREVYPGGHEWAAWRQVIPRMLRHALGDGPP